MATVIFDFDSTLVSCESLEEIIKLSDLNRPQVMEQVKNITKLGMDGAITFSESLQRRLELVQLTKTEVNQFANDAIYYITPGMELLIKKLIKRKDHVHIVSGGLKEAILPLAEKLTISRQNVHAVQLIWDKKGKFVGINPNDKFSQSKVAGIKALSGNWSRPLVSIGDGQTDLALYEQGLVDYFILFTQHVTRDPLMSKAPHIASNVDEISKLLDNWL